MINKMITILSMILLALILFLGVGYLPVFSAEGFPNNMEEEDIEQYNQAVDLYKTSQYARSYEIFNELGRPGESAHALYRMSKLTENPQEKMDLLNQCVDLYKQAIEKDSVTVELKFNYEFVKKQLEEMKEESEQNEDQQKQDNQENQEGQDNQEKQEGQDNQEKQEGQDNQENQEGQDNQENQEGQDNQENQEGQDNQENQEGQDNQENQEGQDNQENQGGQDNQENQGGQESQEGEDNQQGVASDGELSADEKAMQELESILQMLELQEKDSLKNNQNVIIPKEDGSNDW
ncbi:hypothetical protein EZV73_00625 [Acidaminobacter sp. JC074]|uniref:hypothetical protein n=1 Tax=Acidaminobacter sp. JC074 TaxID=2530199 RepID=UPI001F0D0D28|nr:hypothetical protein [Acidaminobacter sp. JC074]MCH4886044.1 hypothetical protein [Acidaminobacter sp. JC074]